MSRMEERREAERRRKQAEREEDRLRLESRLTSVGHEMGKQLGSGVRLKPLLDGDGWPIGLQVDRHDAEQWADDNLPLTRGEKVRHRTEGWVGEVILGESGGVVTVTDPRHNNSPTTFVRASIARVR